MSQKKPVIIISGSTATGKSNIALALSQYISIEIVNADIGSFYTPLTIGTAKPDWKNQKIKHHFFDVIDSPSHWTAPEFRKKLSILIDEIFARGNTPVIVGGSAFYIQSFFYENKFFKKPEKALIDALESQEAQSLWHQLNEVDQERAASIDISDHYRLVRALALWKSTGIKPSTLKPQFAPLSPFLFLTLSRDREDLYHLINKRVDMMIEDGWIEEVENLSTEWKNFLHKKKMIGYDTLLDFLETNQEKEDFDVAVTLIKKRTRNYAKRQVTFLKKLQKNVQTLMKEDEKYKKWTWFVEESNLTLCDLGVYIKQLSERLLENLE